MKKVHVSCAVPGSISRGPSILFLGEVTGRHAVGGKARGLAALVAQGFPVPEAFVALPEATVEEISVADRRLDAPLVAVRSSAQEEDSERLSYAGQFATFLNVRGEEALLRAVEACRASVSNPRLAAYRDDAPAAGRMCVIVQRMLEPEYAGVAFGEAEGEVRVEGVAGLGEALVSGRSAPAPLPGQLRGEVERLAREVARRLGAPQDIEWACEKGRIWLLQARPITVPLPTALPPRFRLWTAANLQEAIPRPLTPLSEEFTRENVETVFLISLRAFGLPDADGPFIRLVKGHFYMSYSAVASSTSVLPGFRMEDQLRMYGDGPELAPLVDYTPGLRLPFLLRLPATLARLAGWALFANRRLRKVQKGAQELNAKVRAAKSSDAKDDELLALLRFGFASAAPAVEAMTVLTSNAVGYLATLMQVAARLAPQIPSASIAALANTGQMESLEPSRQLAALAEWLREHPGISDDAPKTQARLSRLLETCGFRCENEPELAQPRWRECPGDVLRLARQMASAVPGEAGGGAVSAAAAACAKAPAAGDGAAEPAAPIWVRWLLWPVARQARIWQQRREAARAVLGRRGEALRQLLLEIGARAKARGVLSETDDVFYLLMGEIETLLSGHPAPELAARVARRRQRHSQLQAWPAPPRLLAELPDGRLAPFLPDPGSGETLRGFGASPGRVVGRARVLGDLDQAGELQPGEVLVTRTTDIAWTPLFRLASALVTEIGAPTSHAAIVARELGLPAVVNLDRATALIRTGDRVFVDGWAGLVRVERRQ